MQLIMKKCPSSMCHASTVLKIDDGQLLIAWFGGHVEGSSDVAIWIAKKTQDGFQDPQMIAQSNEAHWNPVLFRFNDSRIVLFYKVGNAIPTWRTMCRISDDNGESFGEEQELIPGDEGGRGPVKNKPIRLKNGRILAPASTEQGIWKAFADISDDEGKTWRKSNEVFIDNFCFHDGERAAEKGAGDMPVSEQSFYRRGVIQPTLWEGKEKGQVHMLLRSTEGRIYRSDSADYGETWTTAYPTELPNNNSGIDLVQSSEGILYLIYNPVETNWGPRTPISLAVSEDDGKTWNKVQDLSGEEGEFSYPAIIADDDFLYITYTFKRQNIAFWKIKLLSGK